MKSAPRIRDGRLAPRPLRRSARFLGRVLVGPAIETPQQFLVRRVFLMALAASYLVAFASFAVQVPGLIGSHGVAPAADRLAQIATQWGMRPWWRLPTLFWFDASDFALQVVAWGGVLLATLAGLGMAPRLLFALLWVGYLSLVNAAGVFTAFQWDALLLEAGALAIFFAPGGLWPVWRGGREPSRVGLWLLRWLVFRLFFLSGVVKLASGDPSWAELTALELHFWTQPLPNPLSWYADWLPTALLGFACAAALVIESLVPFLIFAPGRLRAGACWLFLALLGGITLTGNYGFFTLLAAGLCLTLLDDARLLALLPGRLRTRLLLVPAARLRPAPPWRARLAVAAAVPIVLLTTSLGLRRAHAIEELPRPLAVLDAVTRPFHAFNAYGLFEVMTSERPELVVEGSRDGEQWVPYEFRWKPGNTARSPGFAGPHMPRLDWQMWFAALYAPARPPWFDGFLDRLLEGRPEVLRLLARDPFGGEPPRFVRVTLWSYRFARPAERAETGAWWVRERVEPFGPVREGRGLRETPAVGTDRP